jgi:hypothetical protein
LKSFCEYSQRKRNKTLFSSSELLFIARQTAITGDIDSRSGSSTDARFLDNDNDNNDVEDDDDDDVDNEESTTDDNDDDNDDVDDEETLATQSMRQETLKKIPCLAKFEDIIPMR